MADHAKPKTCPECGQEAPRLLPKELNGVFKLDLNGVGPQNTGVSEVDLNIDRIVGEDAKKGWKAIEARNAIKGEVLASNPGATPYDLSKNPDGSYRVMAPEEKKVHARAFTINALAMQRLKKKSAGQ